MRLTDFYRWLDTSSQAIESVAIPVASKTAWGGAWTGFVGFVASVNWLGVIGLLVAVLGTAANVYFGRQKQKREKIEWQLRMKRDYGTDWDRGI